MKSPLRRHIRYFTGIPPVLAFADSEGSPLIIDTSTRIGYYLDSAGVVQSIAPGTIDTLVFNSNPNAVNPQEMQWSDAEQTLVLGFPDGVVLRLGLDEYTLAKNVTGSPLTKGTVVCFAGSSSSERLDIEPFLVDGVRPNSYLLGLVAEDIANTQLGHCLRTGRLSNLDTTGAAVSETWLAGDILYAHPTIAGALTKVRPSAPDSVIPVAVVLAVNATTGELYIKPSVGSQTHYGGFSSTADQTAAAANTAYAVTFDTTDISAGVAIGSPSSRIVCDFAGLYDFQFSLQLQSTTGAARSVWVWYRINGVDISNSASRIAVASSSSHAVAAWNFVHLMNAGDYFELMWATDSTLVLLEADVADTFRPTVPSASLTVNQVAQ